MKRFFLAAVLVIGFIVSVQPPLIAQEQSSGATTEHAAKTESSTGDIFRWVNFVVLVGGMIFLLRKPAGAFFESRKNEIAEGLERGRKAEDDANLRMQQIEQRLSRMSADLSDLRTQAESESTRERENITAEARREMERVVEQSRQEIDRLARSIERDIKEKIAEAVIDRAGQTLTTQMTEDDQKRIIVRFLKKA